MASKMGTRAEIFCVLFSAESAVRFVVRSAKNFHHKIRFPFAALSRFAYETKFAVTAHRHDVALL